MKRKIRAAAFSLLMLPSVVIPAVSAGSTALQFLKIGSGARPAAMGEAFTGVSDDVNAIMWNPSGLTRVETMQQIFMHGLWFEGITVEYAGVAWPAGSRSSFGIGIEYVNIGEISRVNKYGNDVGSYNAYDLLGIVSYARKLRGNLSVGSNIKIVQEKIEDENARGFALDVGAMYRLSRLQLGLVVKNIGTEVMFRKVQYPMPREIRLGLSYHMLKHIVLASDITMPSDGSPTFHFGGEYTFPGIKDTPLAVRYGFRTTTIGYLDVLSGMSFGLGARFGPWGVDYALTPYGALGMTHRINVVITMGTSVRKTEIVVQQGEEKRMKADDLYQEALQWYDEKAKNEKLSVGDRITLLERIREKFSPLGVDTSGAQEMILKLKNGK